MAGRAPKGGTTGINGYEYEGGQFLPSSAFTVKGAQPQTKGQGSRKQEIDNYVWEVPPTAEHVSIYRQIAGTAATWNGQEFTVTASDVTLDYMGMTRDQAEDLAARWNAGERWMLRGER